ncbi:hypothetical protein [Novosphingobium sp. JCM 18896]|uniref:hypothetical protein n=1 Tax=Novosphingobium sp. JCM 18896 TaxID=2989731 RepID=UPI0022212D6E|nr:hypothetical protein [Novosphingobium sp. JCM 18896]MCW1430384.1 hypothetical protein [Novosphingobium sp. JCM 18896]
MSKQLALSAAFSIFMMAAYVLLGSSAVREPIMLEDSTAVSSPFQVSAAALPTPSTLLSFLR